MNYRDQVTQIKKEVEKAKQIIIILPQNPNLDAVAAALSLYLNLKEAGKATTIASASQMRVEFSKLVGIDKIAETVGNRNLVVSFDYKEDSIEKVSYNVENDKFNLVIQPRSGFPALSRENVNFSFEGLDADIVFVFGAQKLEDLGTIYDKERQSLNQATIVNIAATTTNTKFGQINIVEPRGTALSEVVFNIIKSLKTPLNQDIAGNIMLGIEAQTQNLQSPFIAPQTFEIVAELMKKGAKRSPAPTPPARPWAQAPGTQSFGKQATTPMTPRPFSMLQQRPQFHTAQSDQEMTPSPMSPRPMQSTPEPPLPPFPPAQFPTTATPTRPDIPEEHKMKPAKKLGKKSRKRRDQFYPPTKQSLQTGQQQDRTQDHTNQSPSINADAKTQDEWLKPKIYQGKTKV